MFWKKSISMIASVLLIFVSACSMAGGPAVDNGTGQDSTAAIDTKVAEIVASTAAAQTAIANAVASTLTAMATNTLESTFTPSLTLTPSLTRRPSKTPTSTLTSTLTFTRTPKAPMVSISVQTNCRVGPGTAYDVLGIMNVGETAQVVGRSASSDYWIIKLPSNPAITCWLWGKYATVVGNKSGLPVIPPPPTPTPKPTIPPDFLLTYDSAPYCASWSEWYIVFKIVNNSNLTWESVEKIVIDETTHVTNSITNNWFINHNKCGGSSSENLEPGETVFISSGHFNDNPSGHNFSATIKVCSGENLTGICVTKAITFIP